MHFLPLDEAVLYFNHSFLSLVNEYIPSKEVTVRSDDNPGMTQKFENILGKGIGIDGARLEWISDYLANRQQCVVLNSTSSDYKDVQAGVP